MEEIKETWACVGWMGQCSYVPARSSKLTGCSCSDAFRVIMCVLCRIMRELDTARKLVGKTQLRSILMVEGRSSIA